MSFVARAMTKRVLRPFRMTTRLSAAEILAVTAALPNTFPKKASFRDATQYFVFDQTKTECDFAWGKPSEKRETGRICRWIAHLEIEPTADGQQLVSVKLTSWVTQGGSLHYSNDFTRFRSRLVDKLREQDKALQVID